MGVQILPTPPAPYYVMYIHSRFYKTISMFKISKIKKSYRFLISITPEEDEIQLTKIATILNQAGLDEATLLDEYLELFYESFFYDYTKTKIVSSLVIFTRWRNNNLYNHLDIKPIILTEAHLKFLAEEFKRFFYKTYVSKKIPSFLKYNFSFKTYFFIYNLVEAFKWNIVHGFNFCFDDIKKYVCSFPGVEITYKFRTKMLGRKINFRRKIKKKKFEEYS